MKRSLLLSLLMLCCAAAFAQPPHYWPLSGGNVAPYNWPFNANNQKCQILYLPGQFANPTPAQNGFITSVWLKAAGNATSVLIEDLEVRLAQTTATTFNPTTSFVTTVPARAAQDLSIATVTANDWIEIPLDPISYFPYDNTKSLIIELSQTAVTNGFKVVVSATIGARGIAGTTGSSTGTSEALNTPHAGVTIQYPCVKPHNMSITNIGTNSADFNWQYQYPNIDHFEFLIDKTPTDPPGINYQPYQTPPLSMDTFQPNTCYYVHIRSNCVPGGIPPDTSGWLLDSFCTLPTCDAPPVNIDVTKITSTTALAVWDPVPGVLKYEYAISIDTLPPQKGTYTTYTQLLMKGLHPNMPYYFHIRAYCSPVPVSPWRSVPFHTAITTEVDDLASGDFAIEAYPNPAGNTVTILASGRSNNAAITITDMTGKLVKTSAIADDRTVVSLEGLTTGMYFVKYTDEVRSEVIKLIKQ